MKTFLKALGLCLVLAPSGASAASAENLSVCPDNFVAFADATEPLACTCSAEAADSGTVWGMDVYTADSSICRAARHAGVIGSAGGPVTAMAGPGRKAYPGVTRNGVISNNYGPFDASFSFASGATAPAAASAHGAAAAVGKGTAPTAAASVCPDNFVAFADATEPLSCTCSAVAADSGTVWGMDVYTADSSICRAARHAGVIGSGGGPVTAVPEPGRKAYPGVTRNGVISNNYGPFGASFRFQGAQAGPAAGATAQGMAGVATSVCPDNFVAFADTTEPLNCTCSAAAADSGTVWGMDVYTADSSICRAARHAGVIGSGGGPVTAVPEPGRKAYPGVTRNGVISNNYGPFGASFRFAAAQAAPAPAPIPPPAAGPAPAAPVQQPIAQTLRDRGEVALYVRFRTGSAELDPETTAILEELLATLKAQPDLNLGLVGHTDNVGTRDYNRDLSYRRAEAVRFWLADHGIALARIAVDGRGFDEPLADNATEAGRATNRRVQAKRLS